MLDVSSNQVEIFATLEYGKYPLASARRDSYSIELVEEETWSPKQSQQKLQGIITLTSFNVLIFNIVNHQLWDYYYFKKIIIGATTYLWINLFLPLLYNVIVYWVYGGSAILASA